MTANILILDDEVDIRLLLSGILEDEGFQTRTVGTDADCYAAIKEQVIKNRTGFYDACGQGIFCNLSDGEVDLPAVRQLLLDADYEGWCTIEQDCDPTMDIDPLRDARVNREYLQSIGFS